MEENANFLLACAVGLNSRTSSFQPGGNDADIELDANWIEDEQAQLDQVDELALQIYARIDGGKRGHRTQSSRPVYSQIKVHLHQFRIQSRLTLLKLKSPINQAHLLAHGSHFESHISRHTIPMVPNSSLAV